ncbi:hypothetical protein BD311DRAFT_683194, partial [Dichomitus squalens]
MADGVIVAQKEAVSSSNPSGVPSPAEAAHPFNNPSADLILRTSDNVKFRVWTSILREASPVFADMFALGRRPIQPSQLDADSDGGDRKPPLRSSSLELEPILDLPELTSTTLRSLLLTIYPPPTYAFTSLDDLKAVLSAAHKYQMDAVMDLLKDVLVRHFVKDEALRVFCIATMYNIPSAQEAAARRFLALPANPAAESYVDELQYIDARSLKKFEGKRAQMGFAFGRCKRVPYTTSSCAHVNYVDSHIWKCILAEASPVFEDMLKLAHHEERSEGHTPVRGCPPEPSVDVIHVSETDTTLTALLRWIYPPPHYDSPQSLTVLEPVLAAAHKYQMDGVVSMISAILINDLAKAEPLRVYAIGTSYRLADVMRAAARGFLTLPPSAAKAYVAELEDISGGAYYRLFKYRMDCVATLADMTANLTWLADDGWVFKWITPKCVCAGNREAMKYRFSDSDDEYILSSWFTAQYQRIASLLQDQPCQEALGEPGLYDEALKEVIQCPICQGRAYTDMRLFANRVRDEIIRRIEEVCTSTYRKDLAMNPDREIGFLAVTL